MLGLSHGVVAVVVDGFFLFVFTLSLVAIYTLYVLSFHAPNCSVSIRMVIGLSAKCMRNGCVESCGRNLNCVNMKIKLLNLL